MFPVKGALAWHLQEMGWGAQERRSSGWTYFPSSQAVGQKGRGLLIQIAVWASAVQSCLHYLSV